MDRDNKNNEFPDYSDVDAPDLMVMPDDEADDPSPILTDIPQEGLSDSTGQIAYPSETSEPSAGQDYHQTNLVTEPEPDVSEYNPYSPEIAGPGPYVDLDEEPDGSLQSSVSHEPMDVEQAASSYDEPEPEPVQTYDHDPQHQSGVIVSEPIEEAPARKKERMYPQSSPKITTRSHDPVDLFSPYDEASVPDHSDTHNPFLTGSELTETGSKPVTWLDRGLHLFSSVLVAMIIALFIQTFVFQLYTIPTTSMRPGLEVGDTVYASKFSYGINRHSFPITLPLGEGRFLARTPDRGDIAVFVPPHSPRERYVKRVVGLPGDTVRLEGGLLFLNDVIVPRGFMTEEAGITVAGQSSTYYRYEEILPDGTAYQIYDLGMTEMDDTASIVVPDGYVFVLGDNRDESRDSRVPFPNGPGLVPMNQLVGKAEFIAFSANNGFSLFLPWTWHRIRPSRFFDGLDGGV